MLCILNMKCTYDPICCEVYFNKPSSLDITAIEIFIQYTEWI
jgi:hypothetical protein